MHNKGIIRLAGLMEMKEVCEMLGISRPTIYRWISDPAMNFPPPVRIGKRIGWREADVKEWLRIISA